MKRMAVWLAVAGLALGAASTAEAGGREVKADGRWTAQDVSPEPQVPPVWEHTGRLLDSSGAPMPGEHALAIRLYDAAEGGNVLWGRRATVLADADGWFSVRLSDALPPTDDAGDATLVEALEAGPAWIECQDSAVADALVPRAAVAATPYALFADEATAAREDFDVAGSLKVSGETRAQELTARGATAAAGVDVAGELSAAGDVSVAGGLRTGARSGIGAVPVGTVILWYGGTDEIPSGWALCDGTDGRPDMRGRFPVGAGDRYKPGDTGGAASVALSSEQMPPHSHGYELRDDDNRDAASGADTDDGVWHGDKTATSGSAGGGDDGNAKPHENRPPFKTIHFIMRVS